MIYPAQLLSLHEMLRVYVAGYLLPPRRPTLVATQLQSLTAPAPGRLVLGVGVGGEDPHEFEVCGVDPRTRGRAGVAESDDSLIAHAAEVKRLLNR